MLVRPELNSRPPARQPDAQPTELPIAVDSMENIGSLDGEYRVTKDIRSQTIPFLHFSNASTISFISPIACFFFTVIERYLFCFIFGVGWFQEGLHKLSSAVFSQHNCMFKWFGGLIISSFVNKILLLLFTYSVQNRL